MKEMLIAKFAQLILDTVYHLYEKQMVSQPLLQLIHEHFLHNKLPLDGIEVKELPVGSKQLEP